jgi:hypothetical protein
MPRMGMGMPIASGASNAPVTVIDDVLFEDYGGSGGEISINYTETRTNSMLYSQDTTDAESYTKTNTAIDTTLYEAPDDSTTANAIKSNSTGIKNYKIQQGSLSVTDGSTYTLSVHAKKGTLGFAKVQFNDGATDFKADFNLNTGAITNTASLIDQAVDAMDDDWYRCFITFQAGNTSRGGIATVFAQSAAGDATPNIAVSGVILLYVWGFQLEQDITSTPYIATTTAARTKTTTLSDTSDVWDFDSSDLMPEADPDGEGVWDDMPELVTNGDFAVDSGWTKGTGWTISGGKATSDGTESVSYFRQNGIVDLTSTYSIQFTVSGSSSGTLNFLKGNGSTQVNVTSNGTYNYYTTWDGSSGDIVFQSLNFVGSVDNVSVTEYAITPLDV